jgi:hypothetical protein
MAVLFRLLKMERLLKMAFSHEGYLRFNLVETLEIKAHLFRRDQGARGRGFQGDERLVLVKGHRLTNVLVAAMLNCSSLLMEEKLIELF